MKRRGFLGRALGVVVAAPAVVLAKKAGAGPTVLPEAVELTYDEMMALKPGPIVPLAQTKDRLFLIDLKHTFFQHHPMKEIKTGLQRDWYTDTTIEPHFIGEALGMESREVAQPKYEWVKKAPWHVKPAEFEVDYNFLQIVRTPVVWPGRDFDGGKLRHNREVALREHLATIRQLLESGKRHKPSEPGVYAMGTTCTGGRQFFGSKDVGRVAYLRNRGLVWRTWAQPDLDALHGEWLSDIGWAP